MPAGVPGRRGSDGGDSVLGLFCRETEPTEAPAPRGMGLIKTLLFAISSTFSSVRSAKSDMLVTSRQRERMGVPAAVGG
jgi:hypothetical protein